MNFQLLIQILAPFSTQTLLPLACISHRFHDLILRILHHRLLHAASLKNHKLVLECFHPSNKLFTPYVFCDYLGTNGLSEDVEGEGSLYRDVETTGRLGKLSGLYSHFRPVIPELENKAKRTHPAGDVPGHPNSTTWFPGPSTEFQEVEAENEASEEPGLVSLDVHLESHERFTQLCTIINLVKVGPRRGLFLSSVDISEAVTRVFRDWLSKRASADLESSPNTADSEFSTYVAMEKDNMTGEQDDGILWFDQKKNVGLRLQVVEKQPAGVPILIERDEESPISYTLKYERQLIDIF